MSSKPYVGRRFHVVRHKQMRVLREHDRGGNPLWPSTYGRCIDSNTVLPKICKILDEQPNYLKVLDTSGKPLWFKRFYLREEVLPKKKKKPKVDLDEKHTFEFGDSGDYYEWLGVQGAKFFSCQEGKDRIKQDLIDIQKVIEHLHDAKELDKDDYGSWQNLFEKIFNKAHGYVKPANVVKLDREAYLAMTEQERKEFRESKKKNR